MSLDSDSRFTIDLTVLSKQQKIAAGAMVAVVAGAFLPWVSIFGISVIGVRGDGLITLIAAIAGLAAVLFGTDIIGRRRLPANLARIVSGIAAGITVLIAFTDMNSFAASGLYVTLFASLAWAGAIGWEIADERKAA